MRINCYQGPLLLLLLLGLPICQLNCSAGTGMHNQRKQTYNSPRHPYMRPDFGKPDLSRKMLFQVIHRFRLVTGILSILSFVDNHKEQSLSFLLVHIRSLHEL